MLSKEDGAPCWGSRFWGGVRCGCLVARWVGLLRAMLGIHLSDPLRARGRDPATLRLRGSRRSLRNRRRSPGGRDRLRPAAGRWMPGRSAIRARYARQLMRLERCPRSRAGLRDGYRRGLRLIWPRRHGPHREIGVASGRVLVKASARCWWGGTGLRISDAALATPDGACLDRA